MRFLTVGLSAALLLLTQGVLAQVTLTQVTLAQTASDGKPPQGWSQVQVPGFDSAYLSPETDFNGFDSVYVAIPAVEFDPRWEREQRVRMTEREQARLRNDYALLVQQALASELALTTGLPQVAQKAGNSLVIQPTLSRFRLTAPDMLTGPTTVSYVDYVGSAQLAVDLYAGSAPIGQFRDYSRTRSFGGLDDFKRTNRIVNQRDFRALGERWGQQLGDFIAGQRQSKRAGKAGA